MADVNASGFAVLEDKIAMFRIRLADVPESVVGEVVRIADSETKATITAGTDAYGKPWPTKKDGTRDFAFVKPGDIVVGSIGRTVITRIRVRHVVLHHLGYARGHTRRGVIPTKAIPQRMGARIKAAILTEFRKAVAA